MADCGQIEPERRELGDRLPGALEILPEARRRPAVVEEGVERRGRDGVDGVRPPISAST